MATRSMLVSFYGYPNEVFNLMPDNGLANLAACLIRAGHETVIWDCSTVSMMRELFPYHERETLMPLRDRVLASLRDEKKPAEADLRAFYALEDRIDQFQEERTRDLGRRMADHVRRERLDFVGFKLWTGAGFRGTIILAEEIKRACPWIKVFGGGPHVDWFMDRPLDVTDVFDVLAYGEGEDTIVQLAECVEGKRPLDAVANTIYREGPRTVIGPAARVEDLDSLPMPCYDEDVYAAMKGDEKVKVVLVDESRGCPNDCHFCIHPVKSGGRRRTVNGAAFVDRLEALKTRYGFRTFRFAGSNPPARLRNAIAEEIVCRGLDVSFSAFAHVGRSEVSDFELLRRAGCRALSFGVESGSQDILDRSMNKHVKVEGIRRSLKSCKAAGIAAQVSIIMPAPHETEATKEETYRLLCQVKPDAVVVSFPALLLGTTWDKEPERFGFEVDDLEAVRRQVMTQRMNFYVPAALWRPLDGYKLDGKTFHELGREMGEFIQRLEMAGITTQLFDPALLMADLVNMSPAEFGRLAATLMRNGDADGVAELARQINSAAVRPREAPVPAIQHSSRSGQHA